MKKWLVGVVIILLLAAGLIFWTSRSQYEYLHPRKGNIVEAIYGLGKVKTRRQHEIKVGVITHVTNIYVEEGEDVQKGQKLIKFEYSDVFTSPYKGVVTHINYHEYDAVVPQTTVLTVQDMSEKFIEVSLDQEGALRVKKGQAVTVLFESVRGTKFSGEVKAIFPKSDEFLAHIEVEGLGKNVLPGMTADVSIIVGKHENVLMIPVNGLSQGKVIVRRASGKKEKVDVKIGGVDGLWAEVTDGAISESDEVLIPIKEKK
ncbi:MAG: efflux RND transporter periplasmic adaptor subunit [Bdellovibrionales bacterium]|nr:efflux RND transporter periplasmic adaptor subunit [Bdellovibrionales bacterium]